MTSDHRLQVRALPGAETVRRSPLAVLRSRLSARWCLSPRMCRNAANSAICYRYRMMLRVDLRESVCGLECHSEDYAGLTREEIREDRSIIEVSVLVRSPIPSAPSFDGKSLQRHLPGGEPLYDAPRPLVDSSRRLVRSEICATGGSRERPSGHLPQ
jgi:hypothetical protein